jgi:hypothetical protein
MTNWNEMSGPELVRAFNAMAGSESGKMLNVKPVNRFGDLVIARKRCEALASSIRAYESGMKAEENRDKVVAAKRVKAPVADGIMGEFKTNPGKYRGKLLNKLHANIGKQLQLKELVKAVYGASVDVDDCIGPLKMVMKGLLASIKKDKLPYKIEKRKEDGVTSYGLYSTEEA